jgi:hypothetical protein
LAANLEALVELTTRGDPETASRWTCKSVRRLAQALQQQGHQASRTLVAELLNAAGYSLQGNRKTKEVTATLTGMRNSPISTPNWPLLWPSSGQ